MSTTIRELLGDFGGSVDTPVRWGETPALREPGVYIVARSPDPDDRPVPRPASISLHAVEMLLDARAELRLDGRRPSPSELKERLAALWLPDESAVYIGLASRSLQRRVRDYYRTPLGARRPHAGGWPLKTLADLDELWVFIAPTTNPTYTEYRLLEKFCSGASDASRAPLIDPDRPLPFANLEWPRGTRQRHGITGATEPREP